MSQFSHLVRLARPIQLILTLLTYGLGLGIARYLGLDIRLDAEFLGGIILVLLFAASNLLTEYFRPFNEPLLPDETRAAREQIRSVLLTVSSSFIAVAAIFSFILSRQGILSFNALLLLGCFVLLALAVAIPPVRLVDRGFGEITQAFLIAVLTPTIAFLLQSSELHRFLLLLTFPQFLLCLSYLLALNFPAYSEDLKYRRRSLLMNLTWQRAVPLHNVFLIAAYLLLVSSPFFDIPFGLIWPALLTLPLAAYQIFQLNNIAAGAKPLWTIFLVTATSIFGLTTYLLTLTFWLR